MSRFHEMKICSYSPLCIKSSATSHFLCCFTFLKIRMSDFTIISTCHSPCPLLDLFMCEAIFLLVPTSGPHYKQSCSPAWRLGGHSRARPAALWAPGSVLALLSASPTPLTVPNTLTVPYSKTHTHMQTHINTWLHVLGATSHLCT